MKLKKIVLCVLSVAALFPMAGGAMAANSPESARSTSDVFHETFKSAMVRAINEGHLESVKCYIERKLVNINEKIDDDEGYTPLQLAAYKGQLEIVKWLVANGADINAVNDDDEYHPNPITYAAERGANEGDWEVVCYLATLPGIDINYGSLACEDDEPSNALTYACYAGNLEMARFLVEHGAKPDERNEHGDYNAIEMAVIHNRDDIFDYFVREAHAEIDDPTDLLYIALGNSNSHAFRYLLDHGAPIDVSNDEGSTPLHIAAENGNKDNIEVLISRCPSLVNERDSQGRTPLHIAAQSGNTNNIEILISRRESLVNERDNQGRTPLHLAADKGKVGAVLCLLNHYAWADAVDREGNKPVDLARQHRINLLTMLRTRGCDVSMDVLNNSSRIFAILTRVTHDDISL